MSDAPTPTATAISTYADITTTKLGEASLGSDAPPAVADHFADAESGVRDALAVAQNTHQKLAELDSQADLVPHAGLVRLRAEAREAAETLGQVAQRRYENAVAAAESALIDSAQPKLASDTREALARQELELALGDASGPEVAGRILGLAKSGSPEVQAILATPYARTALIARRAEGVDKTLAAARRVVAVSSTSPEALKAQAGLAKLDALKGAASAAIQAVRSATRLS